MTKKHETPKDWPIRSVKDIAQINTGGRNTQDRQENGHYPFFVRSQVVERINSYSFDGEAVLTAGDGVGVGKVFHYIRGKFDCHQRVYRISNFEKDVNGFYFFKYFQANFYKRIMQMTAKSSVDSVRMEMISEMEIPIPPLPEQMRISEILNDADRWIDQLGKLISKKSLLKEGLMQYLFIPKKEWINQELQHLLTFGNGKDYKHLAPGTIPVYGTGGLMSYVDSFLYDGETTCIGRKGSIDKPFYFSGKLWTVDTLFYTHSFRDVLPKFIYYKFLNIPWREFNEASGVPSLSKSTIEKIEIAVPSMEEQVQIVKILSDVDTEIEMLENKLEKARMIKMGLEQQLLSTNFKINQDNLN